MSFAALSAIKAVYKFMSQGRTEALATELAALIASLYLNLRDLREKYGASDSIEGLVEIPSQCPKSPIFSLLTPDPRGLAQYFQRAGFVVRAIVAPTVPEGFERVRVCLHSGNNSRQIGGFIRVLQNWIEQEKQKRHKASGILEARL